MCAHHNVGDEAEVWSLSEQTSVEACGPVCCAALTRLGINKVCPQGPQHQWCESSPRWGACVPLSPSRQKATWSSC
eukprot:14803787-Alexandrium_andersonii.AAC.1